MSRHRSFEVSVKLEWRRDRTSEADVSALRYLAEIDEAELNFTLSDQLFGSWPRRDDHARLDLIEDAELFEHALDHLAAHVRQTGVAVGDAFGGEHAMLDELAPVSLDTILSNETEKE